VKEVVEHETVKGGQTQPHQRVSNMARRHRMVVATLQETFPGQVIAPGDRDYDKARTLFYGGFDKRPAAIVRPRSADEIAKLVRLAKTSGMELSVRSGAHSLSGYSISDGGIVLDLTAMKQLEIDTTENTAWAQTGLTAIEVIEATDRRNLVMGFGDTGSVGVGGITLGGGVGFLVRKFGMTIDNVLAAEIITADGQMLFIDEHRHPDLFWAIRGGGGNFGVVSRFQYRLHPLGDVFGGILILPATPEVIAGFIEVAAAAPDELSTIVNVMTAMDWPFLPSEYHGKLVVMALMMYAGDPKQGDRTTAAFRALAKPIVDMTKPMRYKEIFFPEDESYHPTAVSRNLFMKTVDAQLAGAMITHLNASDAPLRVVQLRVLGGAMARVAPEATAFAHRLEPIMVNVASLYEDLHDKPKRQAWVTDFAKQLYQADDSAYVGFVSSEEEHPILDVYPKATLARLTAIKKQYDPSNLFRSTYPIRP
jgi:FAD/FMN-containing dehydrogenase